MTFIWPWALWILFLVPVLVLAYILAQRRRRKFALRYSSLSLVKEAVGKGPGIRRHIPVVLFLLGVTSLIFALARPAMTVTLPSRRGTVILTLDVSGSMRAEDMIPNRMEAAKAAALTFVEKQAEDVRIGIVSFSAHAALVQAPTVDREKVIAAINRLRTQRGTAVGSGLLASLDAVFEDPEGAPRPTAFSGRGSDRSTQLPEPVEPGSFGPAVVILLTDGQSNQGPDPLDVAQEAANLGVRVYTVGVGSATGAVIGVQGRSIRVLLDEDGLKEIARKTDAEYYRADNEGDLQQIYGTLGTEVVFETEKTELTVFVTAFAMLVMLAGGVLSVAWFGRFP